MCSWMSGHMCSSLHTIMLCPTPTTTTTPMPSTLPHARTSRSTRVYGTSWKPRLPWTTRSTWMYGTYGAHGTNGIPRVPWSPSTSSSTLPTRVYSLLYENLSTTMLHTTPSSCLPSSSTTSPSNASLCSVMCTNMLSNGKEISQWGNAKRAL